MNETPIRGNGLRWMLALVLLPFVAFAALGILFVIGPFPSLRLLGAALISISVLFALAASRALRRR